jgi:hypothetical protein
LHQVVSVVAEAELGERGVRGRHGQPTGHAAARSMISTFSAAVSSETNP